ncbi:poly-beta-1,6-N-acetyl-D-glucosamine synthase [Heyndrickxia acidicola]|uniref:Poly-beta-1,6-N-acetyl-D-glucosamine synthase n=1 Tax=Heyndrickxia acidicola TaxID=209389 RepID=A0ABU6MGX9_9BACI|nr:poly-beta-1,6-N-acetyl-D-glucosamine synthase [Heyndrickxia acidicola]MED1203271.1 poly-beta-1,6-N-acetyl-D-glucosamine synthase [Heyndrickxia acidicola]
MENIFVLFLFYYPLVMGILWVAGSFIYFKRKEQKHSLPEAPAQDLPFVSILIPAYNEEETIAETVRYASNLNYPHYEIIVINDGSKDNTLNAMESIRDLYPKLRIVDIKQNKGKANALKQGVLVSKGEFIAAIDSDAILEPDALRYMIPHFVTPQNSERVGAVTGNPRIRNRSTLLSKIQLAEYASIIGLIKRTQRIVGKVMTVSGVFVVFRKKALLDVGLWDTDLITDDIGITWKLQRRFWDIRYEPKAFCWMLVPETFKGLWKQRARWAQGGIEVVLRHWGIFLDWRQRRLYPVYIEQVLSILWALVWFIISILTIWNVIQHHTVSTPFLWIGYYLSIISIFQFFVALFIERHYEKNILKYLIWTIWYPLIYWHIGALLVVFSLPKALKILKKSKNEYATWDSPDRGLPL